MIFEKNNVVGIEHTSQPSAIHSVMNDFYNEYNIDRVSIPENSFPVLSHTYRVGFKLKSQIKSLEEKYDYIVIPNYLLMWNINPNNYDLKFAVYFHDLYRAFVNKSFLGLIASYNAVMNSRKASEIFTNSKITKNTIEQSIFYDIDNKIQILEPIISDVFYPEKKPPKSVEVPKNYFLYIGSHADRKNTSFLLDVLEELPERYNLVVGGNSLFKNKEANFKEDVKSRNLEHRICYLGYLSAEDLRRVYSNAQAYLLPSKYGGYELTPVESESCDTPAVLHENIPSSENVSLGETFNEFNPKLVADILKRYIN